MAFEMCVISKVSNNMKVKYEKPPADLPRLWETESEQTSSWLSQDWRATIPHSLVNPLHTCSSNLQPTTHQEPRKPGYSNVPNYPQQRLATLHVLIEPVHSILLAAYSQPNISFFLLNLHFQPSTHHTLKTILTNKFDL